MAPELNGVSRMKPSITSFVETNDVAKSSCISSSQITFLMETWEVVWTRATDVRRIA